MRKYLPHWIRKETGLFEKLPVAIGVGQLHAIERLALHVDHYVNLQRGTWTADQDQLDALFVLRELDHVYYVMRDAFPLNRPRP